MILDNTFRKCGKYGIIPCNVGYAREREIYGVNDFITEMIDDSKTIYIPNDFEDNLKIEFKLERERM